jgi:hypothetical protein
VNSDELCGELNPNNTYLGSMSLSENYYKNLLEINCNLTCFATIVAFPIARENLCRDSLEIISNKK